MSIFRGDASEVYELSADLSSIGSKAVPRLRGAMGAAGVAFAKQWSANAVETSGTHGRFYPKSIDSELVFDLGGVSVDVGPNRNKKQGGMGKGFEFGSQNQPPHLDGLKAHDAIEPLVTGLIASVINGTFNQTPVESPLREYTTRSGTTRLATEAQIAHWTRAR